MRKVLCDRLCDCHQGLSGADDDELFGKVLAHLSRDHPAMPFSEDRVREFVAIRVRHDHRIKELRGSVGEG